MDKNREKCRFGKNPRKNVAAFLRTNGYRELTG
jgi:hypothetical protein